jgi:hypothetical protein
MLAAQVGQLGHAEGVLRPEPPNSNANVNTNMNANLDTNANVNMNANVDTKANAHSIDPPPFWTSYLLPKLHGSSYLASHLSIMTACSKHLQNSSVEIEWLHAVTVFQYFIR